MAENSLATLRAGLGSTDLVALREMYVRHRESAGEELVVFLRNVRIWLHDDPEQRHVWVEQSVDAFLRSILKELPAVLSTLTDVKRKVDLVRLLTATGVGPGIDPTVQLTVEALVASAPVEVPSDAQLWLKAARHLLEVAGHTGDPVDTMIGLLQGMPSWLLTQVFLELGKLKAFTYFSAHLGRALAEVPSAADSFAAAMIQGGPQRLTDLLRLASVCDHQPQRGRRKPISTPTLLENIAEYVEAIRAGDVSLGDLVGNAVHGWRDHSEEQVELYAKYLNAKPANHEEVVDFCSFSGETPPEFPLAPWGLGQFRSSSSSSMLTSSGRDRPNWFSKPDFDANRVLSEVSVEAAVWMVLQQPNSRYALQYLQMLSRPLHADFDQVCEQVCADPGFRVRLNRADAIQAAAVLEKLESLRHRHQGLATLFDDLFPKLVMRLPSGFLRHRFEWLDEGPRSAAMKQAVLSHIQKQPQLCDLRAAVHNAANLPLLTQDEIEVELDRLDVLRYLPPEPAAMNSSGAVDKTLDPRADWFRDMSMKTAVFSCLLPRVLAALSGEGLPLCANVG